MDLGPRFWSAVDDVLATVGFAIVLGPVALVATAQTDVPVLGWQIGLLVTAAAAAAIFRERGGDIGDLGSFVFTVLPVAIVLALALQIASVLATAASLVARPVPDSIVTAVAVAGGYAVAYWYAFRGGRERVRGRGE